MTKEHFLVSTPLGRAAVDTIFELVASQNIRASHPDFSGISGGLKTLVNIKRDLYPLAYTAPSVAKISASTAFKTGYAIDAPSMRRIELSRKWLPIIESLSGQGSIPSEDVTGDIRLDDARRAEFERDWLPEVFDAVLKPHGLDDSFIVWNWIILRTAPATGNRDMGISMHWHYDNHYPETYPKIMIFLNDADQHHSGTDILDAATSEIVSNRSEYVGLASSRISDLPTIASADEVQKVTCFRPKEGEASFFWPSRVLHRGVLPTELPRFAISFSLMPSVITNKDANLRYYQSIVPNMENGVDSIPYFIDRYDTESVSSKIEVWNGLFNSEKAHDYILKAVYPNFEQFAGTSNEFAFHLAAYLTRFIKRENIDQFLDEFNGICLKCLPQDASVAFEKYVQTLRADFLRYSHEKAKDVAFWPNPTHESHPKSLIGAKPFVRKYPILDRDTRIATAGSCFASEISAVLQERGFNYLVAERPDDISKGVMVDGYNPGDTYVKFSANFGLLFNSPSLVQLAQRAYGARQFKRILVPQEHAFVDPYRENVYFRDYQAYEKDYEEHSAALRTVFDTAELFVFTMGLNECWKFRDDDTAISRNPRGPLFPLVKHHRLTVEENVSAIKKFFEIIKARNPAFKMILTVSPVPFLATGISDRSHVIEANCHSKSVLRVAAQELVEQLDDVFYFPSYEMVMHTLKDPWEPDLRHVTREAVSEIIDVFYEMYSK